MSFRARIIRSAFLVGLMSALSTALAGYAHGDPVKAMERHVGHRHGHPHGDQSGKVTVQHIGRLDSVLAESIRSQVNLVPFALRRDNTPILLQGDTLSRLDYRGVRGLKATYRAGYSIVLLDATLSQVNALHRIVGEGVNYRSKNSGSVMAYSLRRQNSIPTVTMLTTVDPSPLRTPSGDPDSTGIQDEENALDRAVDITIAELEKPANVGLPGPPRDLNQPIDWLANPVQSTTFAINGAQGVYNTSIGVYALHSCDSETDHYAVSALGDWTATTAKWQSAGTETLPGANGPTMYLDSGNNLVINWRDDRIQCSSQSSFSSDSDICRYINYPLSYSLTMAPQNEGTVTQLDAKPSATQGQQTSYSSGFSFSVSGTVNVSAQGPGGGLGFSAAWNNVTQTTVPPLIVDVQNTGNANDEGVNWSFKYCTSGLEPDPGTNCTSHVQMVKDVCQAQLGNDSGNNPQQGQTPVGKLSNTVQSAHWQAGPDTRANNSTFDIEVAFTANLANTTAHLGGAVPYPADPDSNQGCNPFNCACVSETKAAPVSKSLVFQIPFPSMICQ